MAGSARDGEADVIASGREPRVRSWRPGGLARLVVIAETVALAVTAAAAVHLRAEAGRLQHGGSAAASLPASPEVTSALFRLLAGDGVTGAVVITAAAVSGAGRAQFTVDAVITGGVPGTFYSLIGSDCSPRTRRPTTCGQPAWPARTAPPTSPGMPGPGRRQSATGWLSRRHLSPPSLACGGSSPREGGAVCGRPGPVRSVTPPQRPACRCYEMRS